MAQEAIVDRLDIEIESSSKAAVTDLNKVLESLARLETAVGKLANAADRHRKASAEEKSASAAAAEETKREATAAKTTADRLKLLSAAAKGVSKGYHTLRDAIHKATHHSHQFLSSIVRIAKYRLIRSALREITQGFSEGARRIYEFAEMNGMEFAPNLDRLKTSLDYLKSSLGALVAPIINLLTPALETLIDAVANLANGFGYLIATLTGQDFVPAIKTQTKAYDDLGKAAKEAKLQLMGWDELNVINSPSSGGGSGSSESYVEHYGNNNIDSFFKDAKDRIESKDWDGLGKLLSGKINGWVDNFDAEGWGKKLGGALEAGLETFNSFVTNTDWFGIGATGATFVNTFVDQIDPEQLGKALTGKLTIAIETGLGFVETLHWDEIGLKLGETLSAIIQNNDLWYKLGSLINGIASGLGSAISSAISRISVSDVLDAIGSFFQGLGWEGALFLAFPMLKGAFVSLFSFAIKRAFVTSAVTDAVSKGVTDATSGAGMAAAGKVAGVSIGGAIAAGIGVYFAKDSTKKELASYFMNAFTKAGVSESTAGKASGVMSRGITNGLYGTADKFSFIDTIAMWFSGDFADAYSSLEQEADDAAKKTEGLGKASKDTAGKLDTAATSANDFSVQVAGIGKTQISTNNIDNYLRNGLVPAKDTASDTGVKVAGIGTVSISTDKVRAFKEKGLDPVKTTATEITNTLMGLGGGTGNQGGLAGIENSYRNIAGYTTIWYDNLKKIHDLGTLNITESSSNSGSSGSNNINKLTMTYMAEGGFPEQGTLALIGENVGETEIIGNVNGRTGVVGGAEITGIADAVDTASARERELLAEQNTLLRGILEKTGKMRLAPNAAAGRWVAQANRAYARVTGV